MGLDEINTYGELLEEIERVKKSITQVKKGIYYEQGDEFDLQIYLVSLEKIRIRNEKGYRVKQEIGIYSCDKCNSNKLNITDTRELETLSNIYEVTCNKCRYNTIKKCSDTRLLEIIKEVDKEFAHELWTI